MEETTRKEMEKRMVWWRLALLGEFKSGLAWRMERLYDVPLEIDIQSKRAPIAHSASKTARKTNKKKKRIKERVNTKRKYEKARTPDPSTVVVVRWQFHQVGNRHAI